MTINLVNEDNKNVFSFSSGGQKVKIKAVYPLKFPGENPSLSLPGSGGSRWSMACGSITPIAACIFM